MNKLTNFNQMDKNVINTSKILQTSFKIVFDKMKENDFVIVENKRRKDKMVFIKLDEYAKTLEENDRMKKELERMRAE